MRSTSYACRTGRNLWCLVSGGWRLRSDWNRKFDPSVLYIRIHSWLGYENFSSLPPPLLLFSPYPSGKRRTIPFSTLVCLVCDSFLLILPSLSPFEFVSLAGIAFGDWLFYIRLKKSAKNAWQNKLDPSNNVLPGHPHLVILNLFINLHLEFVGFPKLMPRQRWVKIKERLKEDFWQWSCLRRKHPK